jgi:hypothetical protein
MENLPAGKAGGKWKMENGKWKMEEIPGRIKSFVHAFMQPCSLV